MRQQGYSNREPLSTTVDGPGYYRTLPELCYWHQHLAASDNRVYLVASPACLNAWSICACHHAWTRYRE